MPLSFLVLFAAMLAVWLPRPMPALWHHPAIWQVLLLAALGLALLQGLLAPVGLVPLLTLGIAAVLFHRAIGRSRRTRAVGLWLAVAIALALATHWMPGFSPFVLTDLQVVSPSSVPISVRAHLDKGLAGLLLLALFTRRSRTLSALVKAVGVGFAAGVATAVPVIAIVAVAGAVHWEPKLPTIAPQWLAINLFLTSLLEECVFRGLIQHRLSLWLARRGRSPWWALAIASVLFGAAHLGGGLLLFAAATAAGVGYGLAWRLTGRIEAPVVAHVTLNSLHFFGFTYPYTAA